MTLTETLVAVALTIITVSGTITATYQDQPFWQRAAYVTPA